MYELYRIRAEDLKEIPFNGLERYTYRIFKPSLFKLCMPNCQQSLLMNLYWYLITRGKFRIYYACDNEIVIHTSYVSPKCYKFPFMKKNDIHIGPCETKKEYRGQGIYPYVITKIVRDYANNNADFFMIIDDQNISSQKGAMKLGFQKISELVYNKLFKIYRIKS